MYKELFDKQWVEGKYLVERRSTYQIAKVLGCDVSVVSGSLARFNIPRRSKTDYKREFDAKELYALYWEKELSTAKIGEVVGCSDATVCRALKHFGIRLRTPPENTKGEKNPNYGKHPIPWNKGKTDVYSEETIRKISEGHKGKEPWNKGKQSWVRGEKHPWWGRHHTEGTKQKIRDACKHRIIPKINTKPELIFIDFYKKLGIANRVEDTRDNSFPIGHVHPDFIIPDMRIAIFVNGDYWHSPLLKYDIRDTQRVDFQIRICKRHKWKPIIVWESDLLREDAEQFVLAVLKKEGVI